MLEDQKWITVLLFYCQFLCRYIEPTPIIAASPADNNLAMIIVNTDQQ